MQTRCRCSPAHTNINGLHMLETIVVHTPHTTHHTSHITHTHHTSHTHTHTPHTTHHTHLSHVVGDVEVHVNADYESDQVLRETYILVNDGEMEGPAGQNGTFVTCTYPHMHTHTHTIADF